MLSLKEITSLKWTEMHKGNISMKYVIRIHWCYVKTGKRRCAALHEGLGKKLSRSLSEILTTKDMIRQRIFQLKCPKFLSSELLPIPNIPLISLHHLSIVIIFTYFSHLSRENAMANRNPNFSPCRIPTGPGGLEYKRRSGIRDLVCCVVLILLTRRHTSVAND